jgi:hypothetical protein
LLLTTILFLRPRYLPSLLVLLLPYLHCYFCSLSLFFVHYLRLLSSFVIFVCYLRSLSSFLVFVRYCRSISSFVIFVRYCRSLSLLDISACYLRSLSLSFFIVLAHHLPRLSPVLFVIFLVCHFVAFYVCRELSSFFVIFLCHLRFERSFVISVDLS